MSFYFSPKWHMPIKWIEFLNMQDLFIQVVAPCFAVISLTNGKCQVSQYVAFPYYIEN